MSKKGKTGLEWLLRESEAKAAASRAEQETAKKSRAAALEDPGYSGAKVTEAPAAPKVTEAPAAPVERPAKSKKEKRTHPRVKVPFEVRYRKGSEQVVAKGINLSIGGAFFETTRFLPIGEVFQAQAVFPEGRRLAIIAEVIWGTNGDEEKKQPPGLGVKFLDVDDKDLPYLKDLIAAATS